jgi:preprotein translocase subunit SecG
MARLLLVLLVLDAIILAAAVLLQAGKGGGLAASFGGAGSSPNSLLGSREAGNLLTKTSWWAGGIFLGLAFVLQLTASHSSAPKSVLDPTGRSAQTPANGPPQTKAGAGQAAPIQPVAPVSPSTDVIKPAPATKQPAGKTPPPAKPPVKPPSGNTP